MGYVNYNANPKEINVGDCVIRGIAKFTNQSWDDVYLAIVMQGFFDKDMLSSNAVWDRYLRKLGFMKYVIPNTCPDCYTIADFAKDHPDGKYLLCTGNHVVCVDGGNYYDTYDSGYKSPQYFYTNLEG